jgi:hypothetical protein
VGWGRISTLPGLPAKISIFNFVLWANFGPNIGLYTSPDTLLKPFLAGLATHGSGCLVGSLLAGYKGAGPANEKS